MKDSNVVGGSIHGQAITDKVLDKWMLGDAYNNISDKIANIWNVDFSTTRMYRNLLNGSVRIHLFPFFLSTKVPTALPQCLSYWIVLDTISETLNSPEGRDFRLSLILIQH